MPDHTDNLKENHERATKVLPDDSLKGLVEKATSPLREEVQFSYFFFFLRSKYMVDSMLVLFCIADPNFKYMHKITVVMISLKAHEVM